MRCKYCGKNTDLPEPVVYNAETYNQPLLVAMPCCGGAVRVTTKVLVQVNPAMTTLKEDDWGNPITKDARSID